MIDHVTFDCVLPSLSPAAQLVLLRIYRQTVGWKRPSDRISLSQFRRLTGYKKNDTILSAIGELELKQLITVRRFTRKSSEYALVWETISQYPLVQNLD